jgi:hypothetical protein
VFSDPKWLIGLVVTIAGSIAVPVWLNRSSPTPKGITLSQPSATLTTLRGLLQSQNQSVGGTPASRLRQPGFVVSANFTASGYNGELLFVVCTLTDNRTPVHMSLARHGVDATGAAETTQPCWLPLPGARADRYTAEVQLHDRLGNELRARSVTVIG